MRLSDLLSKPITEEYIQVDGFLQNKKGNVGQNADVIVGKIALNYFCNNCEDLRTFYSKDNLSVLFVNKKLISTDCILMCGCGASVPIWFLIESKNDITSQVPEVRILKKSEGLFGIAKMGNTNLGEYKNLLDKAEKAYNEGLGAGAIVYLRKAFEKITIESANAMNIQFDKYENGNPKNFSDLLKKVDQSCSIIPKEFSKNSYRLFRELSNVVHGEYDEKIGLTKFEPLYRLVVGVLENAKNHKEIVRAMKKLQWNMEDKNG